MHNSFVLFLAFAAFALIQNASAAPCCAGSGALPSLITGDEAMLFSAHYTYGHVVADAPAEGIPIFRDPLSPNEDQQSFNLNFATLLDRDRIQAGVSVPVVLNSITTQKRAERNGGLSDIALSLGYEAIQELEYSLYKPRIFVFIQTVFPTGKSVYDSTSPMGTDVRGMGLWQTHLGTAVVKRWSDWDVTGIAKFGRVYGKSTESIQINGFWVLKASLGAGYSFTERLRLGLSLEPTFQSPTAIRSLSSQETTSTSKKTVWDTVATFSILAGNSQSITLSYLDQTLMGPAVNTSLSRTGSLAWTHRWER